MRSKEQSHPRGILSTSTSGASSMTYFSNTSTLPTNYTPRKRHRSPTTLSTHQRVFHYGDLSQHDITQLTSILSHGPAPHLNRNGVIWTEYRERVTQLIDTLPHKLRRLRFSSWLSPLCTLHRHMNHAPLVDILHAIEFELEVRRLRVWQPVIMKGLLRPELVRLFEVLENVSGLWLDEESFLGKVGRPSNRKFEMQKDGCAACILARIGGDAEAAKALGALMLGAMRKVMVSHRVGWCREWIKHSVDASEVDVADMERLGDLLRKARKEWKTGRHVKGGGNDNDDGHGRDDDGGDYHEDYGLPSPPPPSTWPPRSDSQIQRYQTEPLPRPPAPWPETRIHENDSRKSSGNQHQASCPGQQSEPSCPPSTRQSRVGSSARHRYSIEKISKGHASEGSTRPSSVNPTSQSDGHDGYQTSSHQAPEKPSPPPPQGNTRPSSQSWNYPSHPPSRPRTESESSHYSETYPNDVPQPGVPRFLYQAEPHNQPATATTHTFPTHIPASQPSFQPSTHWYPSSPPPIASPDSMTGVYRGTYSTVHQTLYFPHILPRWTATDVNSGPMAASPHVPVGYWGPVVSYLAVPNVFYGVDVRSETRGGAVDAARSGS